jgi:hypothetical protein
MITANPFNVLDRTGHMPYTESARHLGEALPEDDRLRSIYNQGGRHYPAWIEDLEKSGKTGVASKTKEGFFKWTGPRGRERATQVYDPATKKYVDVPEPNWNDFWSIKEAEAFDQREGTIKSVEGLIGIAASEDRAGKTFRRYAIPIMLYGLDLIQDGFATPGDVNTCTKAGLRRSSTVSSITSASTVSSRLLREQQVRTVTGRTFSMSTAWQVLGAGGPRSSLR